MTKLAPAHKGFTTSVCVRITLQFPDTVPSALLTSQNDADRIVSFYPVRREVRLTHADCGPLFHIVHTDFLVFLFLVLLQLTFLCVTVQSIFSIFENLGYISTQQGVVIFSPKDV